MTSEPRGRPPEIAETSRSDVVVDQAIFGYSHGHQLLESTTTFDDQSRLCLDRLTDGTGAEALAGFDGYLSGFPLPDGRYVFTRTWVAAEAKRPGSVWTRAAIIGREAIALVGDPGPVIDLLAQRPRAGATRLAPMRLDVTEPSRTSSSGLSNWASVVTALIASDTTTVGVTCESAADAEQEVRALWRWLWPAIRNNFAFSLGATSRPSLTKGRYFDFVGVPSVLEFGGDGVTVDPLDVKPAGAAIWSEIAAGRTGELTQYVRFCGAETSRRSSAAVLTNVWTVATNRQIDINARQLALAEAIVEAFPDPATMRRLKRSVFNENGRLPVDWSPTTTLEVLAVPSIAACVLAADVELEDLVRSATEDPGLLIRSYETLGPDERHSELDQMSRSATVLTELPEIAQSAIASFASPPWMDDLAESSPRLAVRILRTATQSDRAGWASHYWALAPEDQDRVSSAYVTMARSTSVDPELWSAPEPTSGATAGWLAAYADSPPGGINWLATCHPNDRSRQSAMIDLASELASQSSLVGAWVGLVHDRALAQSGVRATRNDRVSPAITKALLLLIDPAVGSANDGRLKSWAKVRATDLGGVGGAHLIRYARRGEPPTTSEAGLLAFGFVAAWDALARRHLATWDSLGDFPADVDFGREWDRAYRLTAGLASLVRSWRVADPSFQVDELLGAAYSFDFRAANQLDDVLHNRSPERKPSTPKKPAKAHQGLLAPLRHAADEVRSMLGF